MIDARGLSCPVPVVMVQNAVKAGPEKVEVLLDADCSVENVTRFASNQGYTVTAEEIGGDTKLTLTKK